MPTQKAPQKKKATTAQQWKKSGRGEPLDLPSGNVALVRRPGLQTFLAKGLIPDGLTSLVRQAISGQEKDVEEELQKAMKERGLEQVAEFMELIDAVVIDCVVEPKVSPVPLDEEGHPISEDHEDRDPSVLYIDEVDFEDREFIFNFAVGGTRDLERFREQKEELVGSVQSGEDVGSEA